MHKSPEELSDLAARLGLPAAELARHLDRLATVPAAASDPTPGPLANAWPGDPGRIGPHTVRPFVAMDFALLKQINSPLHRQMLELAKPADQRASVEFTDQDEWEMILQFTRSCRHCANLLSLGRAEFAAVAAGEIGEKMNPFVAKAILAKILDRLQEAWSTAIQYLPGDKPGEETTTVFPAPPAPTTASAGGSITSAACKENSASPRIISCTTSPSSAALPSTIGA